MREQSLGKEFLEVAIEIERNGRDFYEQAAGKLKNKESRNVLLLLASREQEHETTFLHILGHLGGYNPSQIFREHSQYVRDLAGSIIFAGKKAQELMGKKTMTDIEAAETGIGFEKDSIIFYSEIIGMLPKEDQNIVNVVINEEKNHLSELTHLANQLKMSG